MSTLQEFLKQRADHLRASLPEKVKIQNEWIQAVDKLLNQIKQWLKDADPGAILQIFEESVDPRAAYDRLFRFWKVVSPNLPVPDRPMT